MAKTLTSGTRGYEVQQLQKQLQAAGYDVGKSGADGVFGKDTAAAVKQYQKDHNLVADGIVGQKTYDSLKSNSVATAAAGGIVAGAQMAAGTKATTPTAQTPAAQKSAAQAPAASAPAAATPAASASASPTTTQEPAKEKSGFTYADFSYDDFSYADYAESDIVKQANALLNQHSANKPGAYQSQWQDEINDYMNQIQNRDPFSYDFNADALYQQYKNNYIQQGQMAMMDTMGQAAALTGGYGNSYAQAVGQQAYNQQLNKLNNVIPELYQMAHDRYAYEGEQLQNMYNMYLGREEQDYGRYMDTLDAWQTERDYLANRYDAERDYDYNQWLQGYNQAFNEYSADKDLAFDQYNAGRDLAWKEYLAEQEKDQAAAELMAGTGNYDRLGDVYGLSDEEIAAIKKANTPVSTGGTGTPTKKYTKLDVGSTAYNTMTNEIGRATSLDDLNYITSTYLSLGYDPSQIKAMAAGKIAELSPTGGPVAPPIVDPTGGNKKGGPNGNIIKQEHFIY